MSDYSYQNDDNKSFFWNDNNISDHFFGMIMTYWISSWNDDKDVDQTIDHKLDRLNFI